VQHVAPAILDDSAITPDHRTLAGTTEAFRAAPSTGEELVAETLGAAGITHCYGVPAIPVYGTFGACARAGLRVVGARHQQAAALMAGAHNYLAGRQCAALTVSPGPAATNALTGVLVARDNCWPLVAIGGGAPRDAIGAGYFQETDGVSLFRPITKWAVRVECVADLANALRRGVEVAQRGRPGPVYVELPEDLLLGPAHSGLRATPAGALPVATGPTPDASLVARAAALLVEAKRPLLIVGKGARWAGPWNELVELVEGLRMPFVTSPIGRGSVRDDHPLCVNSISWHAQARADVVLLIGGRLDWTFRFGAAIAADARLIQVDIEADELRRSGRVALGIEADAGLFLAALVAALRTATGDAAESGRNAQWTAQLEQSRSARQAELARLAGHAGTPISPYRLAAAVRDCLPEDAVCVLDGNIIMAAGQQIIPSRRPASRLTAGSNGCMGVGIPFSIAAKLHEPQRPVVALCGDFAVGLSAMEMETAVRYGAAIVVVVSNNDGNSGALRQRATFGESYPDRVTAFQPGVRYDEIMRAAGGCGAEVVDPAELEPALRWALSLGRPACVNVRVDPLVPYPRD
jgi:2-hydroxyacyl-CoA lyase 1